MEKFLKIPVTSEQLQLVRATGVALVEQASTTTVTIQYVEGLVTTITHATAGAGDETQRDAIQNLIIKVLSQPWTDPSLEVKSSDLPFAISGIAAT
jgi:hypothetical protein